MADEKGLRSRLKYKFVLTSVAAVVFSMYWGCSSSIATHNFINPNTPERPGEGEKTNSGTYPDYKYRIKSGDTLSDIFEIFGFGYSDLTKVMETDLNYLTLDTIKPKDELRFWETDDGTHRLKKLSLQLSLVESIEFVRSKDGSFTYSHHTTPSTFKKYVLFGSIRDSFSQSAYKVGLNSTEIEEVVQLLKEKVNFSYIRSGDTFEIVQSKQFVGDTPTGNSSIEAIKVNTRGRTIAAYLFNNGQYYDGEGRGLKRHFRRYPTAVSWRISSSFKPSRRHPVTGLTAPHNGTDFATPVGTSVLAVGDGVVKITRNHMYAGKYVVIRHDSTYTTRYLHLSQILVHEGQYVSRGQRIALSGGTGRVTGPHLHYELIVKGQPVDAMKTKIPTATWVPSNRMDQYKSRRDQLDMLISKSKAANDKLLLGKAKVKGS